jgi:hypothetical protein
VVIAITAGWFSNKKAADTTAKGQVKKEQVVSLNTKTTH